jgi:hypothetical protein
MIQTFLDREWNPKTKILNVSFVINNLCIADSVFLCKNGQKVYSKSKFFSLSQKRSFEISKYPEFYAMFFLF